MSNPKPEDDSEIPVVAVPPGGFSSKIPSYLLEGKSEAEQYILIEVSKFSEFSNWTAKALVDTNMQVRRTNGRVKALEIWKGFFTSWYGFAGAILSIIGGLAGLIIAIKTIAGLFTP